MTKEEFLSKPYAVFDDFTPDYIKEDEDCIRHSLHNDVNSYFYISTKYIQENKDIRAYIAQEAIRQKHILMSGDIREIKGNFEVIKYSIEQDSSLIDKAILYDITKEQQEVLTDILLKKGYSINKYTNPFLFNFRRLIYNLLLEDPNCVKYFETSLLEDKEYFEYIKKAILTSHKEFILEPSTGDITTNIIYSDFDLIKLSTENDCNSIENCSINYRNNRQLNEILEILIRNHYVINTKTNYRLKQNKILQESSFLIDPNSIKYMDLTDNQDLLFRGINHGLITRETFEELELFIERTPNKSLCHAIAKIYGLSDKTIEFFDKFMEKDHPISLLKPIIDQTAIASWNAYRNNNTMLYDNLFLRTITELPRAISLRVFINHNYPFNQMCKLVGRARVITAFDNFYEASKNHALTPNEINEISTICSLFISKAKDEYISTETDRILKTFYPFYTLNEDNPIVHKKLYEQKRKPYTRNIVNEIIAKYLKIANKEFPNRINLEFINDIYNAFLEQKEPLIVEPLRYKEFLLKTELDKLIIRLNKGNIKIDSLECKNYLKYIKFNKKFYVDEIKFTEEELLSFKEYVTKTMISKKMIGEFVRESKKQNENIIIPNEEKDSLREVLPFIDEYFTYNPDSLQKINIKELMEVLEVYDKTIKNLTIEQIEVLNRLLLDQDLLYYASNDNYTYVTNSNVLIDLVGLKTVINGFSKLFTTMRKEDIKASNINLIIKNIKLLSSLDEKECYTFTKDLYSILEEHKDDETIIYEIIPENSDKRYRELIYNISKLNIEPKYKKFYIEQLKFHVGNYSYDNFYEIVSEYSGELNYRIISTGNYSYKDLYELVNMYINELKNKIICPYNHCFPILITEKTFIDNIALFIACLKLNLKPQLVELNYIEKIDEDISIPDHSFGIYSSGSFNKKLIIITEQQLIEKKHYYDDYSNLPIISQGKLYGISGIEKQIIFPIIMGKTSIVTREEELIETIKNNANRKIDISLPANCDDLLNQIENPIKTNIERIYIGGGNVNPQRIQMICKLFNVKEEQISLVYGQTERCGIITHSNLIKNQPILKIRLDSLASILLGENYRKDEILIENFDFEKNYNDNPFFIYIFPMGKENSNLKLTNYPIGEIICNDKKTEDIGYIDENHIFYVL